MQAKKILFFVNSLAGGGAERVCLNLADEFHKEGYLIDFVVLNNTNSSYVFPEYINTISLEIPSNKNLLIKMISILKKLPTLNKYLKSCNYELVTSHLYMSHITASLTCLRKRTLYVMHSSQWEKKQKHRLIHYLKIHFFYKNKKIVAVSDGVRQELIKEYKLNKDKAVRIYNPVPIERIKQEDYSKKPHLRPYIISMGRLSHPKRPDLVLDMFYYGELYKEYDLIFLGEGPLKAEIEKKILEYKINDKVFLIGFEKEPYVWLKNAKLMISVSDREALPMNIIESLACNTGVVAADCRYGPNEILVDDLSKFLINPHSDFEAGINTIKNALKMYPAIDDKYISGFSPKKIADQYLSLRE